MPAKKITNQGFLNEFKRRHDQMPDRPFCWILGSGSSVQSGIPTGRALAFQWLKELHEMESSLPIEEWATAENLGIRSFEYRRAENFYPWIYQRRYHDYKEQGYAFLENVMERAEPSFGYSVLAQVMATTAHKVAVTTNFDNLIADALSIYTRTFPLVCGHESLTGYIRPNLRRPLVAKIHRDLLLAPLSNPEEIANLPGEWAAALAKIFDRFTPIVIGYGGNDGSLMGFLETLRPIEGGVFWCYREGGEIDRKIHEVVEHHRGRLVPIAGFDELMLQFQEKLELPFLLPQLKRTLEERVSSYQKQFEDLNASLKKPAETEAAEEAREPVRKAAEAAVERLTKEKNWWAWQLKANAEQDPERKEAVFWEGLEDFPESHELINNFALFMEEERSNFDEAERLYVKGLALNSNDPTLTGNFALFMHQVRKEYREAGRLYRLALALDPNNAIFIGNYAAFMDHAQQEFSEAERLYREAVELKPEASKISNLAQFLATMNQLDEARRLSIQACQLFDGQLNRRGARLAFTRWLLDRGDHRDGDAALGRLKTMLVKGFTRRSWSFDRLLATMLPRLTKDDQSLAQKLAAAINDETKVKSLNNDPLWNDVNPIPLEEPWLE